MSERDPSAAQEPAAMQVTRFVPAEHAARFEELLREVIAAARGFDGHLGVDVLRPDGGGGVFVRLGSGARSPRDARLPDEELADREDRALGVREHG